MHSRLLCVHYQNVCTCKSDRALVTAHGVQVRNAATLAYVALVARLLGLKNTESESHSRKPATSLQAFLCSYPSLASFLLQKLTAAVAQTPTSHAGAPHPHLHPILLLFSNMQRSDGEAREGSVPPPGATVAEFEGVIRQCLSMPSLPVRTLAARALAALCPAGGLPAAVAQQLEVVAQDPAGLRQESADAVHGALLACHHMLLNAVPPCSIEECSSTLAVAAPMLKRRLWLLQQRVCGCAAVSREFVHVLEAFNAAHTAADSCCDGPSAMLSREGEKTSCCTDVKGLTVSSEAQAEAAQALITGTSCGDKEHVPMQDLWCQSMARLSLHGIDQDQDVVLGTAVHALHSESYCLRIEACRWLASTNLSLFESKVQQTLAEELWAVIRKESNQIALGAALEAAVHFGGALSLDGCSSNLPTAECLSDPIASHSSGAALQQWLVSLSDAVDGWLRPITATADRHGKDLHITQQALKCTGVLLGGMLDACTRRVHMQDVFVESECFQCVPS
jgi:hypothetical protein